ncbi:MAG TPA: hypothetical protein VHC47_03370 [Mucilaginibacter sp.]|nr:hypothetical protein [Mucilaginibacter sp.]
MGQVLNGVESRFAAYQQNNLREKIYLHANKSFYLAGEILWFKVYCTDGSNNNLLDVSKVAMIELLDNSNTPVMQAKVALSRGMGNGSLLLPFTLTSGNYKIRAYTNWMKNFSPDGFFESQVTIVNPLKTPPVPAKQSEQAYDVQFFPEGGHLVQGLNSRIGFKVTGADGKGVSCEGAVTDQKNDTIVRFRSLKFGIGSFDFKPLPNSVYKTTVIINNSRISKELPQVSTSGYVLHVKKGDKGWEVTVQSSDSTRNETVYAVVHNNHAISLAEVIKLSDGKGELTVEDDKPADGISYVTLFDAQQRPLCERTIFKRPEKKLSVIAVADSAVYTTRKKVDVGITTADEKSQVLAANLSLSVFRDDGLQDKDADHIDEYLWLRSDLKGYIESPGYYFENNDSTSTQAFDNLLLTQGWTQFDWDKVLAGGRQPVKFLPEYTGPIIAAHITNLADNKPANDIKAYLTIPGIPDQLYVANSDSSGRLLFNTQNFYGLKEILIETNSLQDSTYRVDVGSPFSDQYTKYKPLPFVVIPGMKEALESRNVDMQVQNIFDAEKLRQFYTPDTDTTWFFDKPDRTYLLDNYTRFPTIEEVLREYVGSIAVLKRQGKFNIKMFDGDRLIGYPLVLLDGMPLFDEDKIFHIDPLKIKKLEMVTKSYRYGPGFFNGIMSFTSYKGDRANIELDPHAVVLDYDGLQLDRKFYSPVYGTAQQAGSTIPDFRSTLYWDPVITTGSDGKTGLSFYTGDRPGRYIGIIEGIATDGRAGSGYFTFEVKE